jgi:hypothetical protein
MARIFIYDTPRESNLLDAQEQAIVDQCRQIVADCLGRPDQKTTTVVDWRSVTVAASLYAVAASLYAVAAYQVLAGFSSSF